MLMDSVLDKLPMNTKNEWGRHVMSKIQRPNVVMLRDWLTDQALANKKPGITTPALQKEPRSDNRNGPSRLSGRLKRTVTKTVPTEKPVYPRCKENHNVEDCSEFKNITMTDRIALLKKTGVCFYCLKPGHITKDCWRARRCSINDCTRYHHPLLHEQPSLDITDQTENITTRVASIGFCIAKPA